jgi:hypothetical protein
MPPGSTVMVERDASGDEEDRPLSLKFIKPKKQARVKKAKPEPAKVGVGAKKDDGEDAGGDSPEGDERPSGEDA